MCAIVPTATDKVMDDYRAEVEKFKATPRSAAPAADPRVTPISPEEAQAIARALRNAI